MRESFDQKIQICNKQIQHLNNEKHKLKSNIDNSNTLLNENIQFSRYGILKIINIPLNLSENVYFVIESICNCIGFEYNKQKIEYCYRLNPKEGFTASPIFLKFVSHRDRIHFMQLKS